MSAIVTPEDVELVERPVAKARFLYHNNLPAYLERTGGRPAEVYFVGRCLKTDFACYVSLKISWPVGFITYQELVVSAGFKGPGLIERSWCAVGAIGFFRELAAAAGAGQRSAFTALNTFNARALVGNVPGICYPVSENKLIMMMQPDGRLIFP